MNRSIVTLLLALGAVSFAGRAAAEFPDRDSGPDFTPKLVNARIAAELRLKSDGGDTTWVGYNPAYAGSNYWSIGVGKRFPPGTFGATKGDIPPITSDRTGYWDWDHPVHGDSLQGWWPIRHLYTQFAIEGQNDANRPWHAVDMGNQISYVINQGPGRRRTFGVTSAWHSDPGVTAKIPDPGPTKGDVNPNPPRWTPISGTRSAWCGLRAHGDITVVDPITGNPYNVDALEGVSTGSATTRVGPGWTNRHYPGYASQWDQMLYRDVDISSTAAYPAAMLVTVSFSYRTRMSEGKGTSPTTRTGWFDKDPLTTVAGNFIPNAGGPGDPIDMFALYVGRPVADTVGASWMGSDGVMHQVFDPVRRWFGELIRANVPGGSFKMFSTTGNDPPIAAPADSNKFKSVAVAAPAGVTYGFLRGAWGNKIRLVFRLKTNRGFDDDNGSNVAGAYNSGYLGAVQLDDVSIIGAAAVSLGGFENQSDINNSPGVSALNAWKTSSKPPAVYFHVHEMSDLAYNDLCGPPGAPSRVCDMAGNVISMGDHDLGEAANGPFGTAEQERFDGIVSPTINLAYDPANPTAKNNMGLNAATAVPTAGFAIAYNVYTGFLDPWYLGQGWQWFFQSYPATQSDGTRMWGEPQVPREVLFDPDKQCFDVINGPALFAQVRTSNAGGLPDSIRIGLRKVSQCYRFALSNCGSTLGGYLDNVSLGLIDGPPQTVRALPWDLYNDTFPANENVVLPGTAAFDTTTGLTKSGLNTAPLTGDLSRFDVPGDSVLVEAGGDPGQVEVQLKFRILPGPGNYKVLGDRCSGLRRVPTDTTRIAPGDGSFWTEYILNPGKNKTGFPTTGPCKGGGMLRHDQRWSELVWCNAIMDTAERNLFPVQGRGIGLLPVGLYATTYHETDPHLPALGIARNKCFLVNPDGAVDNSNIICGPGGGLYPPAWVSFCPAPPCPFPTPYPSGWNGSVVTTEGTKIIPDGLLTPGSHVEYYFLRKDLLTGMTATCPELTRVYPQRSEESLDAHRWEEFSVLPDAWKFPAYGGLGKACMLYVDWADRRGDERVWVSTADSIGATTAAKRGAHNGWTAPSTGDINNPLYFVDKNAQPGTTWDMYGVKAAESLDSPAGTLGARLAFRGACPGPPPICDKWALNAPTPAMLSAYYRILLILTGDIETSAITGPFANRSSDDTEIIRQFLVGATAVAHRGLWCMGSGYVSDLDANLNATMLDLLSVSLRQPSYQLFSGNTRTCIDLIPTAVITTNGDIYGIRNSCLRTLDVLQPGGDGVAASHYDPVGANPGNAPYVAGVFTDAEPPGHPDRHFQALVDGWDIAALNSRLCDTPYGRLAYFWNVFTAVFGKICAVAGSGAQTTEVPNNDEGRAFVDLAGIGNNPLRSGSAIIHLTLAHADRVTVKIYDVSGRLVRALANGQLFKAGKVDPALTWDGLDDAGRRVARGAYFVSVRYEQSRYEVTRKMIVLR